MITSPTTKVKIYDVCSLSVRSRSYNSGPAETFRNGLKANEGKLLCVVHPLYLTEKIAIPERVTGNVFLQEKVSVDSYRQYVSRLGKFLRTCGLPAFVFVSEVKAEEVTKWLDGLGIGSPLVFVKTEADNSTPNVGKGMFPWKWLSKIITGIGGKSLLFAGELGYQVNGDFYGCVYDAKYALSNFPSQPPQDLIYPNVWVRGESEK